MMIQSRRKINGDDDSFYENQNSSNEPTASPRPALVWGDDLLAQSSRQFVAYFHFGSWADLALGASIHLRGPHVEIHIPFGFVRVGFIRVGAVEPINQQAVAWRSFGIKERYRVSIAEFLVRRALVTTAFPAN